MTRQQENARATSGLLRPATVRGDIRVMQRAIVDGEDLDGIDEDGWTVRHRPVQHPTMNPTETPAHDWRTHPLRLVRQALDFAASLGQLQAAQVLLESGADATKRTPEARAWVAWNENSRPLFASFLAAV